MLILKEFSPHLITILDTDSGEETKIESPKFELDYDVVKKIIEG